MRRLWAVAGIMALAGVGSLGAQDEKKKDERAFTQEFLEEEADLVSRGKNPFFVLEPGYELVLEGKDEGKEERLVITVLDETRTFGKVETRVVEERETVGGKVHEVSRNYFAISRRTNAVFYFGEDVDIYDRDGEKVVKHEGSWLHGKDDAHYGLVMPGTVLVGARYYQERAENARDRAEIVSVSATLETPAGTFEGCLKVEETTPLEPDSKEYKLYAPGIGLVKDGHLRLTRHGFKKK